MERIDFVIPWVDGGDPAWASEFVKYKAQRGDADAGIIRYRDWDNLQYWFRGVEKFAPWVGKIHFITWGHLPEWLNTEHPKLHIVNHRDYIPEEYLPTFSSFPIELNMHRIEGLSERFVYFNDDMFLIRDIDPKRFFRGGLPCDRARLAIHQDAGVDLINRRYDKNKAISRNMFKWFNVRYKASDIFKTLTLIPWQSFYGFDITHMPQPFLKSVFEQLWDEEFDVLDKTSRDHLRVNTGVCQYGMRYEQIASGRFAPCGCYDSRSFCARESEIEQIHNYITRGEGRMLCINDAEDIVSFEGMKNRLKDAFDVILPNKSSYER